MHATSCLCRTCVHHTSHTRFRARNLTTLTVLGRSLYRPANFPRTYETQLHIASRLCGPQGALGLQSALLAHGFDDVRRGRVHVVTVRRARQTTHPFAVHESVDLVPRDITMVNGLVATTPERSLIDVARRVTGEALGDLVDDGIRKGLVSIESLTARFLELGRRGRPGTVAMRSCLEHRSDEIGPDSTFFEKAFDRIVGRYGFPTPVKQYRVVADERTFYLDRAWPEHGTWVECDSVLAHATARQLDADLRRQNAVLNATGLVPLRFSYRQVMDDPMSVANTLAARLPQAA